MTTTALLGTLAALIATGILGVAPDSAASESRHRTAAPVSVAAPQLPRSELFTFHSDAFINLHHFLYRWGQAGDGALLERRDPAVDLREEDVEVISGFDDGTYYNGRPAFRTWNLATQFYRASMVNRDLLFDRDMVKLRDCLVMAGNYCDRLSDTDEEALELLNMAMPVYRDLWRTRHDYLNEIWINEQIPLAKRFEARIAPRIAAAYGGEWPGQRLRVDVAPYANRVGGYTTADGHITISSTESGSQGNLGLELLFHEASHADPLEGPLRRMIDRAFDAIGAETPPDLWHMTIFYTAGEITRSVLAADAELGDPGYATYAETAGMWERREDNRRAFAALDVHWKPALEAQSGYQEAMRKVAEAWVASGR